MESKKTLVIGASTNPERYSHKAVLLLQEADIPHIALGLKEGTINETAIVTEKKKFEDIQTVSLYVGSKRQDEALKDYLLKLAPKRVIFNPGTENPSLMNALKEEGIEVEAACTLVLLRIGQY